MKTFEQTASEIASGMASRASTATYSGAGAGVFGALASIDWVAWIGVGVAVIGLFVNIYYRRKETKLKEAEMELIARKIEEEHKEVQLRNQKIAAEIKRIECGCDCNDEQKS